jgi:hypothetical protein
MYLLYMLFIVMYFNMYTYYFCKYLKRIRVTTRDPSIKKLYLQNISIEVEFKLFLFFNCDYADYSDVPRG